MNTIFPQLEIWLPGTLAMFGLLLVSGFFSASETALFFLSHDELRTFRVGNFRERLAAELLRNPDRLLTAILFWNLLINLVYFATGVVVSQRLLQHEYTTTAGLFGILSLFAIILFGEVIPKSTAVVFRRSFASLISFPLATFVRILDPVSRLLSQTTKLIRRTFWPHIGREPVLEADDLERAVEASHLGTELVLQERQILHGILDLSEITVEEVMRPRGTYPALSAPIDLDRLKELEPGIDYVVVKQDGSDEIEKVIPLNDFTTLPKNRLENSAEELATIPWCANLAGTLELLRNQFLSVASVVNEYGESIGIITFEDIMDSVLLPQSGRAKRLLKREPVVEVSEGVYHVEGITTLRYLCRQLGIDYEPDLESPLTVAGNLSEELQHLPQVGDECRWQNYDVKVISESKRGQFKASFTKIPDRKTP